MKGIVIELKQPVVIGGTDSYPTCQHVADWWHRDARDEAHLQTIVPFRWRTIQLLMLAGF